MNDLLQTVAGTDIAFSWITALFADNPGMPLSAAFAVFTSTLTLLGSLLMSWHVMVGIVSSAYSGKVLGDKWHQIWAPLRVVLGFGMLIPVGGGFSAVHYLLKDVIGVAAVNLGNAPILAYIGTATNRSNLSRVRASYGDDLANEVLRKEICFAVVSAINEQGSGRIVAFQPKALQPASKGASANWYNSSTWEWDYGTCGKITIGTIEQQDSEFFKDNSEQLSNFNKIRVTATSTLIDDIRQSKFYDFKKIASFVATRNGAWGSAAGENSDTIDSLIQRGWLAPDIVPKMKAIGGKWNDQVSEAAGQVFANATEQSAEKLQKRIKDFGFMVAGSYERQLSAISGMVVSLAAASATIDSADLPERYQNKVDVALSFAQGLYIANGSEAEAAGLAQPKTDTDWVPWLLSQIFPDNFFNMIYGTKSADPVGDMIAFGHTMLNTASLAIVLLISTAGGASTVSAISQAPQSAFNYAAAWISPIIAVMIGMGVLYAFLLPMLPMIMVFIMGLNWLILFLEAAIAGVLWAFAFIRMDGQEFFDKNQVPGVTLLFNLLLRPALGMLAYCGMLLLQPLLLNSLAEIWDGAFSAQSGNISLLSFVWIWQYMAGLVLYGYLQWHLVIRLTGLIPTIPDRVGHWMGMQMHNYNDGHEVGGAATALAGGAMLGLRQTPSQIGSGITSAKQQSAQANERANAAYNKEANNVASLMNMNMPLSPQQQSFAESAKASGVLQQNESGKWVNTLDAANSPYSRGGGVGGPTVANMSGPHTGGVSPGSTQVIAGQNGRDGIKGDKGDRGEKGTEGTPGTQGMKGADGKDSGNKK